jgi:hypothetical protein
MTVGITQDNYVFDREARIKAVVLTPHGLLDGFADNELFRYRDVPHIPYRVVLYFTLLGWDSEQVNLSVSPGSTGFTPYTARVTDSWVNNTSLSEQHDSMTVSGSGERLFGGITGFELKFNSDGIKLDKLLLSAGFQRSYINPESDSPTLSSLPSGGTWWGFLSETDTDGFAIHTMRVDGVVLQGHNNSLLLGADRAAAEEDQRATLHSFDIGQSSFLAYAQGPRAPIGDYFYNTDTIRDDYNLAWPVKGDVAFTGLNYFFFYPEGPVEELDVEIAGDTFLGNIIDWKMGLGVNTLPGITGGLDISPKRGIFSIPTFGSINRGIWSAPSSALWSEFRVRDAVVGCTNYYPRDVGFIESKGQAPLLINDVNKGNSTDDSYFDYHFNWRGQTMSLAELKQRLPILLWKNEKLEIRTTYTPLQPGGVPGTALEPHHATLIFNTNSEVHGTITYRTNGSTRAGNANAEWLPDSIDFGYVPPEQSITRTAMLHTTGDLPLCINELYIEDPNSGFEITSVRNTPEPEVVAIAVRFINSSGLNTRAQEQTRLIANTNAGMVTVQLSAEHGAP